MVFSPERLLASLDRQGERAPTGLVVAFSGGRDSSVLLHAMAALRARLPAPVRAIHINHALHPEARDWERHCHGFAARLEVDYRSARVTIDPADPVGVEAAARAARYAALRERLGAGEWLLTAHHADDQLETVLLQLLRGAGVAGLAAMPRAAPFGQGWLRRPLLDVSQAALGAYADTKGLVWCDDPSNAEPRFDRNYLRQSAIPALQARWPAAARTISRSARHCAEASELLDDLATIDLAESQDARPERLRLERLRELRPARQANLLRHWLMILDLPRPNAARLTQILNAVVSAAPDAMPCVAWRGGEVRRYRECLYAMRGLPDVPETVAIGSVAPEIELILGHGLGRLQLVPASGAGVSQAACAGRELSVRFRAGGERCRLTDEAHRKPLKKLFQERGIVPWMRARLPLIFADDALAAIAGIGVAAPFAATPGEPAWRLNWREHPPLR